MIWDFMKTEWFVTDVDNWHIKEGAPQWVVDEFNEWKKSQELEGVMVD